MGGNLEKILSPWSRIRHCFSTGLEWFRCQVWPKSCVGLAEKMTSKSNITIFTFCSDVVELLPDGLAPLCPLKRACMVPYFSVALGVVEFGGDLLACVALRFGLNDTAEPRDAEV